METIRQKRGEFIPIISGGIHTGWYNRVLNIMPTVLNNDTTTNSSISSVCMYAKVKYRYTSNKGRMYFPKNLDVFDSIYVEKKGNSYKLIAKRYFHIHGEIDLRSELTKMEELQVCNIEFFSYLMEENNITIYRQVKCKDQFGEYYGIEELPF